MTIRAEPISSPTGDGFIGQFNIAGLWRTLRQEDGKPEMFATEAAAVEAARAEWVSRWTARRGHVANDRGLPNLIAKRRAA